MIGDAIDFKARLRATLPVRWFPDTAPVLDALLGGLASAWASVYALLQYMRLMARISTAAGTTLDFIAGDYFGRALVRRIGESDFFFAARIKAELLKPRATRAAVIAAVTRLTGVAPLVFEPSRPADTGAYNSAVSLGYGLAGGYGSYARQAQFYIVVTHGVLNGPPLVGGYYKGSGWAGGGYGSTLHYPIVRTNFVRNPRAEGTVAGTPGTTPTDWGISLASGLSQQIVGTGAVSGVPYADIRVFGTSTVTGLACNIYLDTANPAASLNQTWTASAWVQLVAGTLPGALELHIGEYSSGTSYFPGTAVAAPAAWARNATTTTVTDPVINQADGMVWVYLPTNQAVDFTLRIGGPQLETGGVATSLILPPVGSPAVTTVTDYAGGALEYWSGASPGGVTDPDIFAAIAAVLPVGVTAWVAFSDGTQTGATGLGAFVLGVNSLG